MSFRGVALGVIGVAVAAGLILLLPILLPLVALMDALDLRRLSRTKCL